MSRAIIVVAAAIILALPGGWGYAEEAGTFEGSMTANGSRKMMAFAEGRKAGIFSMEGHLNLKNAIGKTSDFWAKWMGLWDTEIGGSVRGVWGDLHGHQIYVVLKGTHLKKGATLSGEFVGGTGQFKGIQGNVSFTWTSIFYETDDKVLSGYARDIKGAYRIP